MRLYWHLHNLTNLYSLQYFIHVCSLTSFPNKHVCITYLLKTQWEKEKLLVTSNFSFSHSVFYLFGEFSAIFRRFKIVICKVFQFRKVYFVVWERVKYPASQQTMWLLYLWSGDETNIDYHFKKGWRHFFNKICVYIRMPKYSTIFVS